MSAILGFLLVVLIVYGIIWLFAAGVVIITSKLPKSTITTDSIIDFGLNFLSFVIISCIIFTVLKAVL